MKASVKDLCVASLRLDITSFFAKGDRINTRMRGIYKKNKQG